MKAALFAATAVSLIPAAIALSAALTVWWYEKRWLPRIAGED